MAQIAASDLKLDLETLPQLGADRRRELLQSEWLGNIVVHSRCQAALSIAFHGVGGQRYNRGSIAAAPRDSSATLRSIDLDLRRTYGYLVYK